MNQGLPPFHFQVHDFRQDQCRLERIEHLFRIKTFATVYAAEKNIDRIYSTRRSVSNRLASLLDEPAKCSTVMP
jgi:hypothetical protein